MKKIILYLNLIVLFISMSLLANAVPDPAVLGATVSPTPAQWPRLNPEQYETFSFQINNNGTVTSSAAVKVEVVLSNLDFDIPFDPSTHITHTFGPTPFNFTWDATLKKLTCTLAGSFTQFAGNTFTINKLVVQTGSPKPTNIIGGIVNVTTPRGSFNNYDGNDETYTYTHTSTRITGTLWDDADGNATRSPTESLITTGIIWANLVNTDVDMVQFSVQVDAAGNYLFNDVAPGTNFKVILTATEQLPRTHLTTADQPAGWVATGVNQNGVHNIDNRSGVLYLASSVDNYLNQNFGMEQPPVAEDKAASYPVLATDERYTLSPNAPIKPQPALSGTDPEDGDLGTGSKFIITSLPANARLYYNGVQISEADVASGIGTAVISNYNPDLLQFSSSSLGILITSYTYVAVDAAGVRSPTAIYRINASGVLAITDVQLKAALDENVPQLTWTTLTEQNTSYFEIENSTDGSHYSKLGTVPAAINSNTKNTYHFTAPAINSNKAIYYRVRLVDKNGVKTTSNTVVLSAGKTAEISIFPNPAQHFIIVKGVAENADIVIVDMKGRIMQKQRANGSSKQLLISGYAAGTYIVQVQENNKITSTKKFIKE